jgi:membrane protease YdiL (CAAX protease family)
MDPILKLLRPSRLKRANARLNGNARPRITSYAVTPTATMSQPISISTDLKTAAVLSGSTGLLGAATVPFLLPSAFELLPPDQRTLPLPLPLFCVVLAIQIFLLYGLFALAGLRMARITNREPAPLLTALWTIKRRNSSAAPAAQAFCTGLLCGLVLVGVVSVIGRFFPHTLPETMHPPSIGGALLGSATASFGEEILCRLFLLSALLRIFPASGKCTMIAVLISSLLFGALHAPAAVFLFGGLLNVPQLFWVWLIVLNAFIGVACAIWYLRIGIGGAILVHAGTDLVWHVLSQVS